MNTITPLNMASTEDRATLHQALTYQDIPTLDSNLGGGLHALEIALTPDNGREGLSVIVVSLHTPCEVHLSGFRTSQGQLVECAVAEPLRPETLSQAVDAVQTYWRNRDAFLNDFHAGCYDLD